MTRRACVNWSQVALGATKSELEITKSVIKLDMDELHQVWQASMAGIWLRHMAFRADLLAVVLIALVLTVAFVHD